MDDRKEMTLDGFYKEWNSALSTVIVNTSGSTGKPKSIRVEKSRMIESAKMTCSFLGLTSDDSALLCMPLRYIAGKMVVVRTLVSGMRLISIPPTSHPLKDLEDIPTFAAMVPMQVFNSLSVPEEADKLKRIKNLIIGGGPVNDLLYSKLQHFPNAVWSTYGMTETLSHIAMRRLNGPTASEYYIPLDGIHLSVNEMGCLCIDAPKICPEVLQTNDIVKFDSEGHRFKVLGRIDNVIISGGVKIHIEEVEKMLEPIIALPFAITKKSDKKFGEIVVMVVQGSFTEADLSNIREQIEATLPMYWQPKRYVVIDKIPMTATGKIARSALQDIVEKM